MKKILTLMSTFAFSSVIITPVLACTNQQQDAILKVISNGNDNYDGWDAKLLPVGIKKPTGVPTIDQKPEAQQTISEDALQSYLPQLLAQIILDKANIKEPIWFNDKLAVGTKCYYFTINNGTLNETKIARTWEVAATTGRINIDITYQVGVIDNDKSFKVEQYIKKTFNIKCFYTQSDYVVYSIVDDITKLSKQIIPVTVNKDSKPDIDKVYTDFSQATKTAIHEGINATINNSFINSANINIKGIDGEKVTSSGTDQLALKVNFIVSFQDSIIDMSLISPYDDNKYDPTILQFNINN